MRPSTRRIWISWGSSIRPCGRAITLVDSPAGWERSSLLGLERFSFVAPVRGNDTDGWTFAWGLARLVAPTRALDLEPAGDGTVDGGVMMWAVPLDSAGLDLNHAIEPSE